MSLLRMHSAQDSPNVYLFYYSLIIPLKKKNESLSFQNENVSRMRKRQENFTTGCVDFYCTGSTSTILYAK